jgi:hypothetical protein
MELNVIDKWNSVVNRHRILASLHQYNSDLLFYTSTIIYFLVAPFFITVTMEEICEKLSLVSPATVLYN